QVAVPLFGFAWNDALLWWGTVAGAVLGTGLAAGLAPRWLLVAGWLLYLSYVGVGEEFLSFQWDNLLLESSFFAFFVTPSGWRLRDAPPPRPLGLFLMQWLLVRLYVESGLAKLLLGDPTWRDLSAMATYYETAPLPTWIGWYVHQAPMWAHRATGAATLAVELVVPFSIWGPRLLRPGAFLLMAAFQLVVLTTGNYGFFNYLSLAPFPWVPDAGPLAWLAGRVGRTLRPAPERAPSAVRTAALGGVTIVLVLLTIVPFLPFVPGSRPLGRMLVPARVLLDDIRSINAYHLFAQM